MRRIRKLSGGALVIGDIPKGCKLCRKGAKLVVFVTGICSARCFYCPLSDKRRGKDDIYANERLVIELEDILEEAERMSALGASLTGGDPLARFERSLEILKLLKTRFGDEFHVHMYTTGALLDERKLSLLDKHGLDELRFHPQGREDLEKIRLAVEKSSMSVGAEVPALPGDIEGLLDLALFLDDIGAEFMNINELELSETNEEELRKRGFRVRRGELAAIEGSMETALKFMKRAREEGIDLNIHFCPARVKDRIQFRRRLLRTARNIAKPYESITEDGTLVKGVIYGADLEEIRRLARALVEELGVPEEMIGIDESRGWLETSYKLVEDLADDLKDMGFSVAIVEEYPTHDRMLVEMEPL